MRGRGAEKGQKSADVMYGRPLKVPAIFNLEQYVQEKYCQSTQYSERILNRIAIVFNETFVGRESIQQRLRIYFS